MQHWSVLAKDSIHTQLWRDKVGLWFKRTGWRPSDCIDQQTEVQHMQKDGCENREKFNPQASALTKLYVGVSFVAIVLVAVMFIFLAPTLAAGNLVLGTTILVYSLVVVNDLLEGNKRLAWFEAIRIPLIIWFASTLWLTTSTTRNEHTVIMDKPPQQVLNYASTPALWPQWHPQSSKVYTEQTRPLIKGDKFEEDILTAIGENHLLWDVVERGENNWRAIAHNQNNGAIISVEYQVKGIEGLNGKSKTEFVRILNYTLPNFLYVAINALYLKPKVEVKSAQSVARLQKAVQELALVSQ